MMQIASSVTPSALATPNAGGVEMIAPWMSVVNTSMRAGRPIRRGTSYDAIPITNRSSSADRIAGRSSGSVTRVKTWG